MKFKSHIFIASLILSSILWFSLSLNMTYELERNVPLKFNIQKPYAVSTKVPLNVTARIRGRGWSLIRLFTSFNMELNYDIDTKLEQNVIYVKQSLVDNFEKSPDGVFDPRLSYTMAGTDAPNYYDTSYQNEWSTTGYISKEHDRTPQSR